MRQLNETGVHHTDGMIKRFFIAGVASKFRHLGRSLSTLVNVEGATLNDILQEFRDAELFDAAKPPKGKQPQAMAATGGRVKGKGNANSKGSGVPENLEDPKAVCGYCHFKGHRED